MPDDVNAVLSGIEPMIRRLLGKNVDIVLQLRPLGPVRTDRASLEQVIVNLAINARDAMPGGGTVTFHGTVADDDTYDGAAEISDVDLAGLLPATGPLRWGGRV